MACLAKVLSLDASSRAQAHYGARGCRADRGPHPGSDGQARPWSPGLRHYVRRPGPHLLRGGLLRSGQPRSGATSSQVAGDKAVDSFAAARGRDLERRYAAVVESAGKDPPSGRALADALTLTRPRFATSGTAPSPSNTCVSNCPPEMSPESSTSLCDAETQAIPPVGVPVQRLATWLEARACLHHPTFRSPAPALGARASGRRLRRARP